jgi:flagellar motor switch protein FliM
VLYEEYLQRVPTPTILHVMSVEPLPGNILLEYGVATGMTFIDRMLGGSGRVFDEAHELTDLERALIEKFAQQFEGLLREAWQNVTEIEPRIKGTEQNTQLVHVAAPGDVVIMVLYEVRIGEQPGAFSICIPYSTLESTLPRLTTQGWIVHSRGDAIGDGGREALQKQLSRVEVPLTARLGTGELSTGELVSLQPGDVIRLDSLARHEVDLLVGSRRKFRGLPGLSGNRLGIRITNVDLGEE